MYRLPIFYERVFLFTRVFAFSDCESCRLLISKTPVSAEAIDLDPTRGTGLGASHLDLGSPLPWYRCVLRAAGFRFVPFFSFERMWPT